MLTVESKGKTVDEAIFNGLKEIGLEIDEVTIEIVQEGTKGIFGLGKSAIVRLIQKENEFKKAEVFLNELFKKMGLSAVSSAVEDDDTVKINITGDSTGVLIGRRGETLDALQYITSLVVNRNSEKHKRVILDTENYRAKREETLKRLADRLANKVIKTGKRVALEPMNPYERRILHATLQSNPKVETFSEGEEPNRRVIIVKARKSSNS